MRRTLALLGVAALAVVGLAAPANASDIDAQSNVAFADSVGPDGTGVRVDTTNPSGTEAWFGLETTDGALGFLDGFMVKGCVGSNPNVITFEAAYDDTNVVPQSGIFLSADPAATLVVPDHRWDSIASGELNSAIYHLALFESDGSTLVDDAISGTPACSPV